MRYFYLSLMLFALSANAHQQEKYTIENKTISSQRLQYDGTLIPGYSVAILSPANVTVKSKHFRYSDKVSKDQLLFELVSPELSARFAQAKMEVIENAQALATLKNWERGHEMLRAKTEVQRDQSLLDHAKHHFEQTQKLYEAGIVSKEEFLNDKRHLQDISQNLSYAQQTLNELKERANTERIELAQMKLAQSEIQLKSLEQKINNLTVKAPASGIILPAEQPDQKNDSLGFFQEKNVFQEAQTLAYIADINQLFVQIEADEFDVIHLKKGDKAQIVLLAFDNVKLNGSVQEINLKTNSTKSAHQAASFDVKILIHDLSSALKEKLLLGMSAKVNMQQQIRGLLVPKKAVYYKQNLAYVDKIEKTQAIPQHVTLGETAEDFVQVVQGINQGDQIVIPS